MHELQSREHRKLFGFVPSGDRTFYLRISGLENLVFFARLYGMGRRRALARAWECLRNVGLEEAARKPVGLYSHGMQKRLSVARGLLTEPPVLFVDEATHDLDPDGARRVRDLVRLATDRKTAVIWTTQRVEEIWDFASSVTLLHQGRVRFAGTVPEMIRFSETQAYVVLLRSVDQSSSDLLTTLRRATHGVARVEPSRESDEHFIFVLRPEVVLGALFERLTSAGVEILDCRQEHSQIEQAFLRLTSERT
jgi:ABC-2 type transport system ATP-binding protein